MTERFPRVVFDLAHEYFAGQTGKGTSVAVVDSGVSATHPHVGGVAGGVRLGLAGAEYDDHGDGLGHGTAVAAAIREKAPEADLYAVRVFEGSLSAASAQLVRAIDWASERGIRLINLSLGTANPAREASLRAAVDRATQRGAMVVSACESDGRQWFPGSLPDAVRVIVDWECTRDEFRLAAGSDGFPVFAASGYPRSVPGVPPDQNLKGVSFAVANVTGFLARFLERFGEVRSLDDVVGVLRSE